MFLLPEQRKSTAHSFALKSKNNVTRSSNFDEASAVFSLPVDNHILDGFIDTNNDEQMRQIYRDLYYHDPICGSCIDIYSMLPFGDFSLSGLPDREMLNTFLESCEALRLKTLFPSITIDQLVDGALAGALSFNEKKKIFDLYLPLNLDLIDLYPNPIHGREPIMDISVDDDYRRLLKGSDKRIKEMLNDLPKAIQKLFTDGAQVKLESENAVYIPRSNHLSHRRTGNSLFRRLVPLWLIEKALTRGTIEQAYKRQRGIMWVQMGDMDWVASPDEMKQMGADVVMSDRDPQGAVLVTRPGVSFQEIRCVAGHMKVSTDRGLVRIDELVKHDPATLEPGTGFDITEKVKNNTGHFAPVDKWWFNGWKETVIVTTSGGTVLDLTQEHRLATINDKAQLDLVQVKDIKIGKTWILKDMKGVVSNHDLWLHLQEPDIEKEPHFTLPKKMTPDLAWVMGSLVSDGSLWEKSGLNNNYVAYRSAHKEDVEKWADKVERLFNVSINVNRSSELPSKTRIKGVDSNCNHKYQYLADVRSLKLFTAFKDLGCIAGSNKHHLKEIPWCILEANHECQLAFLAAYIDGDESIPSNAFGPGIRIFSASISILESVKLILGNMGYDSNVYKDLHRLDLAGSNSWALCQELRGICKKAAKYATNAKHVSHKDGIPAELIVNFLQSRFVKRGKVDGISGVIFLNDDNQEILVKGGWVETFKHYIFASRFKHYIFASSKVYTESRSFFLYDRYITGFYDKHLTIIKAVSPIFYRNIVDIFENGYKFETITEIKKGKLQPVYDLTMSTNITNNLTDKKTKVSKNRSSYCLNLIICKNSGGEFWKVSDVQDAHTSLKLKGLGCPESLISGELSVGSADSVMSVFNRQMRGHRDDLARAFLYEKVFPYTSMANGFRKEDRFMETSSDRSRRKEFTSADMHMELSNYNGERIFKNGDGKYMAVADGQLKKLGKQNPTHFYTPTLHWHDSLRPEIQSEYMDNLDKLQQRGIAVPLRTLIAAAGLTVGDIVSSMDEDVELRKVMSDHMKKIKKYLPATTADNAANLLDNITGSASAERRNLLDRADEMDQVSDEYFRNINNGPVSRKGKVVMNERADKAISEAAVNLAVRENNKIRRAGKAGRRV